jgi:glycosyltransferase involved in cell wall biosynthesis
MKSNIKPLVSILTPSWNRSAYLEKVWIGIDTQGYSEVEWIIANDGSIDDTAKVCLELQRKSRFPVTIIEASVRIGKPRMDNELIKASKGDFVIWCDSDDYLVPGAIERLVSIWETIPIENQTSYIGLVSLCSTETGALQSTLPSRSGVFDTTLNELGDIYNTQGDMLIFLKAEKIKNSRFVEVDFMIPESSLWSNFSDMKIKFIPEIMKIMDRGVSNRISFSGKMEYCRGKAYSIALCEKIKPTVGKFNIRIVSKLITYHRYCIHGDIRIPLSRKLWSANVSLIFWLILYPVGLLLAIKDLSQGKLVKTHIEYDENVKLVNIRIINPASRFLEEQISN